uniref:valine--tRNA ligase n=1 Tax=Panagrolaimus superbus TaxID=310955 RepID=A0A914YPV4_9BILA
MLGDVALMVHPEDERYIGLIGQTVTLPLVGRSIPIIADDYVDPAFGTGVVKVTPAHDFNDYAVGQRHGLEMISILTLDAHIADTAPEALPRPGALCCTQADRGRPGSPGPAQGRQATQADGATWRPKPAPEDSLHPGKSITQVALDVVADGRVRFYPDNWSNTYNQWLNNIQDWCISRQLWWGHQIPAWYAEDGSLFVARSEEDALEQARAAGVTGPLRRDEDVLGQPWVSTLWTLGSPSPIWAGLKNPGSGSLPALQRAGNWLRHYFRSGWPAWS